MKILFVYTNPLGIPYYDFGIGSLSSLLKSKNHKVELLDFTFGMSINRAIKNVKKFNPEVILFTSRTNEFQDVIKVAKSLKKELNKPMFCGGIHPTVAPEDAIKHFDGICIGEGEEALLELIDNLEKKKDYTKTKGFWFNKENKIIKNPLPCLTVSMDKYPFPDRDVFEYDKYLKARNYQIDFMTSRGCPFQCTYCVNHTLQQLYKGKGNYIRTYSIPLVIKEIKRLKSKYKIKTIFFLDETFNWSKQRLKEFSEAYKKEINIPYECCLRADLCDEEVFKYLKNSNCYKVAIAIESGNEKIRKGLLEKHISDEQIIKAFKLARKYGITSMSYNMVGLPFETKKDIQMTINLNKKAQPDALQVSIFNPFYGTKLYTYCKDKGLIRGNFSKSYYTGTNLYNPNISQKELIQIRNRFAYNVYRERSMIKACLLLLKENIVPIYLKFGRYVPIWFNNIIYNLFWNFKPLRFLSK